MKKAISLGLSATLFISACAPKDNGAGQNPAPVVTPQKNIQEDLIETWKKLNIGQNPNMPVAEIVLRLMNNDTREFLKSGTLPENKEFLKDLAFAKDKQKRMLLLGNVPYMNDQQTIVGTALFSTDKPTISSESFTESFDIAREKELQNRALKSINDTFEARSKEIAGKLASVVLKDVAASDIAKIEKVSGTKENKINEIVSILKKYDRTLAGYEFKSEDNVKIVLLGLIAGAIADEVAQNKTVKRLILMAQDLSKTVALVKEVCGLIQVAEDSRKAMKKNMQDMRKSFGALKADIEKYKDQAFSLDEKSKAEGKRLLSDLLYGRTKEVDGKGVLSQPIPVNPNLQTFADSADSAAKNLSNIIKSVNDITAQLGIKIDPGVAKALNDANRIATGISLAKNVIAAATTGGFIGALGAFTAGGGMGALGFGGGDPMAADIAAIKKELSEIKELQRDILKAQIETMKMIQDLANLMTSYHREQMYVLRQIRATGDMNHEISVIMAHEDLASCQTIVEFALRGQKRRSDTDNSVDLLSLPRSLVYSSIADKEGLSQFIRSTSSRTYEACQHGLVQAFGESRNDNVKLVVAFDNSKNYFGVSAKENFYELWKLWNQLSYNTVAFGMHLPAVNMAGLSNKLRYAWSTPVEKSFYPNFSDLLSTEVIERYVAALLVVGPVMSFDKEDWSKFIETDELNNIAGSWRRQDYFLNNALEKIQVALAQESLIAGEPLLEMLSPKLITLLSTNTTDCESESRGRDLKEACAIKGNPILRKNLMTYVLNKRLGSQFSEKTYTQVLASKDAEAMSALLGAPFTGHIVQVERDGVKSLALNWSYGDSTKDELPTAQFINAGKITYTENVTRLLSLQQKVVDAILEITPTLLSTKSEKDLLSVMAVKN